MIDPTYLRCTCDILEPITSARTPFPFFAAQARLHPSLSHPSPVTLRLCCDYYSSEGCSRRCTCSALMQRLASVSDTRPPRRFHTAEVALAAFYRLIFRESPWELQMFHSLHLLHPRTTPRWTLTVPGSLRLWSPHPPPSLSLSVFRLFQDEAMALFAANMEISYMPGCTDPLGWRRARGTPEPCRRPSSRIMQFLGRLTALCHGTVGILLVVSWRSFHLDL